MLKVYHEKGAFFLKNVFFKQFYDSLVFH